MKEMIYEEPKLEIVKLNFVDIIKTSGENDLDKADKSAGSTNWKW